MNKTIKIEHAEDINIAKLFILVDGELVEQTSTFDALDLSDSRRAFEDISVVNGVTWTRITYLDELDFIEKVVKGSVSQKFNFTATIKDCSFDVFFTDKRIILERHYQI